MFVFFKESWKALSNEEDDPPEFTPPPPLPPPRDPHNCKVEPSFFPENVEIIQQMEIRSLGSSQDSELRKRNIPAPQPPPDDVGSHMEIQHHASEASTKSQQQHETKEQELPEAVEQPKENPPVPGTWSPLVTNVCLCTALALGAYACYRAYFH